MAAEQAGGGCGLVLGCVLLIAFISQLGGGSGTVSSNGSTSAQSDAEERRQGFHCLSHWDGSHRGLVQGLKRQLRDPNSFEHESTRITAVGADGYHRLVMVYRARNGFGGMNVGTVIARVRNSDCSVEIVSATS